jgi:hypothetical protein
MIAPPVSEPYAIILQSPDYHQCAIDTEAENSTNKKRRQLPGGACKDDPLPFYET